MMDGMAMPGGILVMSLVVLFLLLGNCHLREVSLL